MPDLEQFAWKFSSPAGKRGKKAPAPTEVESAAADLAAAHAALDAAKKVVDEAIAKLTAIEAAKKAVDDATAKVAALDAKGK